MGSNRAEKVSGKIAFQHAPSLALALGAGCLLIGSMRMTGQVAQPQSPAQIQAQIQAQNPTQNPAQPVVEQESPAEQIGTTEQASKTVPIAIVPIKGVKMSGALEIADGKAAIESNGSITAGEHAVQVTLPNRGILKICPTTKLNLLTDASTAANATRKESPGLMMALDRGAFEGYFATRRNSDVILTPGYRVVVSGPGTAAVQVRLGDHGDLCIGNAGQNAPYVTVSSIFEGGVYRVNANQRVNFQHGSLNEVVDREKESCGCPPDVPANEQAKANEFPIAQSEGFAPLPSPPPNSLQKGVQGAQATIQLSYSGGKPSDESFTAQAQTAPTVQLPKAAKPDTKPGSRPGQKPGFFHSIGRFFKKIFGG